MRLWLDSLHGRLNLAAILILVGFLGSAGFALHEAFRNSAEAALRERLLGHVYALLAAADEDRAGRMLLPKTLPDQRFSKPESGLYALVVENTGPVHWRSPSLTGLSDDFLHPQLPGHNLFSYWHRDGRDLLVVSFGIAWEDYQGRAINYTFAVAADVAPLWQEIQEFSLSLWAWLGGLAGILLIVQGIILYWGLKPLRTVALDLTRIETGLAEQLNGTYPKELQGLTNNINALLKNSRAKQQRYRQAVDDLAHSLKTPLAILRNAAVDSCEIKIYQDLVQEQTSRMDSIVQHQLRRAAAAGHSPLGTNILITPVVERLLRSLNKVYRDKAITVNLNLVANSTFVGDEADLLEVLGNICDNAFKYGKTQIQISSYVSKDITTPLTGLVLQIEDDGPGINSTQLHKLMQRGQRLDETVPGQGIGLAVARDIVTLYGGHIEITRSTLGGVCVLINWTH